MWGCLKKKHITRIEIAHGVYKVTIAELVWIAEAEHTAHVILHSSPNVKYGIFFWDQCYRFSGGFADSQDQILHEKQFNGGLEW